MNAPRATYRSRRYPASKPYPKLSVVDIDPRSCIYKAKDEDVEDMSVWHRDRGLHNAGSALEEIHDVFRISAENLHVKARLFEVPRKKLGGHVELDLHPCGSHRSRERVHDFELIGCHKAGDSR